MVSKARLDLPLPLGPVTTVSLPSGRSTSIPLRLFWRAPRISMHSVAADAAPRFFSIAFKPTGDDSRCGGGAQISGAAPLWEAPRARTAHTSASPARRRLQLESRDELFALLHELVRNNAPERIEKLFVLGQFSLPFFMIHTENVNNAFVFDVELSKIEIVQAGQPTNRRSDRATGSL